MTATTGPAEPPASSPPQGWAALRAAFAVRPTPGRLVACVLLGLLGFAMAVQVRSTQHSGLDSLRQNDLVGILDNTSEQSARLRAEAADLEQTRRRLATGTDSSRTAIEEAQRRADAYGILAGTVPAVGPGISMTIPDSGHSVTSDVLLDAVEELRDAGAEAMQVNGVRIVASTSFTDARAGEGGHISVDGRPISAPYTLLVIGDPRALSTGLAIPGGVDETLRGAGSVPLVVERTQVAVTALRAAPGAAYARPTPTGS